MGRDGNLTETSVVVAREGNASCELAGEAVILNLESGKYHGLNPVGSRVWELVQEPRAIAELRDQLLTEYEVTHERMTSDLLAVRDQMKAAGLIAVSD